MAKLKDLPKLVHFLNILSTSEIFDSDRANSG